MHVKSLRMKYGGKGVDPSKSGRNYRGPSAAGDWPAHLAGGQLKIDGKIVTRSELSRYNTAVRYAIMGDLSGGKLRGEADSDTGGTFRWEFTLAKSLQTKALDQPKKGQAFDYYGDVFVVVRVNKDGSIDAQQPHMDAFGKETMIGGKTFAKHELRSLKPVDGYWFPKPGYA